MDKETLLRLSRNPHYKLSDKQKEELARTQRVQMIQFGEPDLHNQSIPKHDTSFMQKRKSTK